MYPHVVQFETRRLEAGSGLPPILLRTSVRQRVAFLSGIVALVLVRLLAI